MATPGTSPKFIPAGSLKKSGTESKASSGTFCCANKGEASSKHKRNRHNFVFMGTSRVNQIGFHLERGARLRRECVGVNWRSFRGAGVPSAVFLNFAHCKKRRRDAGATKSRHPLLIR